MYLLFIKWKWLSIKFLKEEKGLVLMSQVWQKQKEVGEKGETLNVTFLEKKSVLCGRVY